MADILFITLTIVFFSLSFAVIHFFDLLSKGNES